MTTKTDTHGFTMIEIIVVIAIIGILATLTFANLSSARPRSRDTKRKTDLRSIASALETYYAQNNQFPPGAGAGPYTPSGLTPNYISSLPVDPLSTPSTTINYHYCTGMFPSGGTGSCASSGASQGYALKATLENTGDTEISAGTNLFIVCGGSVGGSTGCAKN